MEWIFDASISLAWCFDDERTSQTDALLNRLRDGSPAVVPQVWPLEVTNVLVLAGKKKRITAARRREFLAMLQGAPITVEMLSRKTLFNDVLLLAEKHNLTSYDASYLELAMRLALPLATVDKDLVRAADDAGVALL
jgi:predicted nucleic acid-binding protein